MVNEHFELEGNVLQINIFSEKNDESSQKKE